MLNQPIMVNNWLLQTSIPHLPSLIFSFVKSFILIEKVGRETQENLIVALTKHGRVWGAVLFKLQSVLLKVSHNSSDKLTKVSQGCQRKWSRSESYGASIHSGESYKTLWKTVMDSSHMKEHTSDTSTSSLSLEDVCKLWSV